jgi:crossover junction endodeoxyribonuclease RuvC
MIDNIRILGIDPGSQITGFGIIDIVGRKAVPVRWGSVHTKGEHSDRLRTIFSAMAALVQEYRPAEIAIERVFLSRNADSALKLGQARAAALCGTFAIETAVHEYSARHIKKAVVGNGGAEKKQVQDMVRLLLGIREALQADAADALAVAICHLHERDARSAIQAALAQA